MFPDFSLVLVQDNFFLVVVLVLVQWTTQTKNKWWNYNCNLNNIWHSKLLSVSLLCFTVVDSPPVEKILSTGAMEAGVVVEIKTDHLNYIITLTIQIFTCVADLDFCWHIQRCELFQTKIIKMTVLSSTSMLTWMLTSLKIFLVLALVT